MGNAAGLAHARTSFQERDFTGGQATVMDELLAQAAAGPAAGEKRFVTVERFVADLAVPGFNPQQHRLPRSATFSDTHAREYSEAIGGKTRRIPELRSQITQAQGLTSSFSPLCLTALRPFVTLRADWRQSPNKTEIS